MTVLLAGTWVRFWLIGLVAGGLKQKYLLRVKGRDALEKATRRGRRLERKVGRRLEQAGLD